MKKSRIFTCALILFLFFGFLIYKLADIQLLSAENYGKESVNLLKRSVEQRSSEISLSSGRGIFVDNEKKPFNNVLKNDIVLFPFIQLLDLPDSIQLEINSLDTHWQSKLEQEKEPIYLSELVGHEISNKLYEMVKEKSIPGIIAVERTISSDPLVASHAIGIVRENEEEYYARYEKSVDQSKSMPIGISGLEKAFDSFLVSTNDETLKYHVDAMGNPLLGLNLRYQGKGDYFYPVKVQTTIDSTIQQMTEQVIDNYQMTMGGLVLLDIETRKVLAMTSRPKIDEFDPFKDDTLENQMLTSHFPGSVFKTVVAAAAIEKSPLSIGKQYDCNNNLYGDGTGDRTLGILSFEESFSLSCNYTFGEIGKELLNNDKEMLEKYSEKLGLIGPVGWSGDVYHFENFSQFPEEEQGRIWGNEQDPYVDRAIVQTAIGQKEVKVTPLAMANMMVTIATNGVNGQVRIADKILYNNDSTMLKFEPKLLNQETMIKKETALYLKKLLVDVVENGTGQQLKGLEVAGKSGTAETGRDGKSHYWFAGFFPKDKPKYALVVVDLNQTNGNSKHYQIYREVVVNLKNGVTNINDTKNALH
ncbi:penicillin-binding transpeptidase domain-containing protein [Aquibacillus halophilus]|uniref:penicillin-binding transpeptidase domain-containing protein n=1 Tax=Aquibacillus halophilus TaxID=930132 RepID=UPI00129AA047|nr:penicillin-binding transpeptidase domain-containing protein [Aquibacillus halophilus]